MPRGASEIADLKLARLNKLVTTFQSSPNLVFMNSFPEDRADSDTIKWESQKGSRGMSPFKAPGAKTPQTSPQGVAKHQASAAFWGEKMPYDETFLNNLRKPGTDKYHTAKARLAKDLLSLRWRCDRRKEWMFVKMLFEGSFEYLEKGGVKVSVDYDITSSNTVTLTGNYVWDTGSSMDILSDIRDAKLALLDTCGATRFKAVMTQAVLRYMVEDSGIRDLLKASAFGKGDLFGKTASNVLGVRPNVVASLLDIDEIMIYDEKYEVEAWITGAVTADSTTVIYVDDATDFEVGGTLRFEDTSAGTFEDETISAVDSQAGTVTVTTAPSSSYKVLEDRVVMKKAFFPTDQFSLYTETVDGQKIAEYMKAPFGLDHHYGMKVDRKDDWDPEVTWVRTQNKGLPVLYNRDAIYNLTVA